MSSSQTSADIRESRTMLVRVTSIMQAEAAANAGNRQIFYEQAALTKEALRSVDSATARMLPFVAADPTVIAEWESALASSMPDPADNVTDATLTGAVQANWVAASEGL
jgi:hypothetical protein